MSDSVTPWTAAHQVPRPQNSQARILEWVAIPFSPGDLPNPGIEPRSPSLQADSLPSEPRGSTIELFGGSPNGID